MYLRIPVAGSKTWKFDHRPDGKVSSQGSSATLTAEKSHDSRRHNRVRNGLLPRNLFNDIIRTANSPA